MTKKQAVLLDGVRTPFGRFKGALQGKSAVELGTEAIRELINRYEMAAHADGVILGNVIQAGLGQNPARQAFIQAGGSMATPAITLNSVCIASLASVTDAARRVERQEGDFYIVGGFESMSNAPHVATLRQEVKMGSVPFRDTLDDGLKCALTDLSMGGLTEQRNEQLKLNRIDQDKMAYESHIRAAGAEKSGKLRDEVIPLTIDHEQISHDECIRSNTTIEKLAQLRPVFSTDGTITAGNASAMSDGASAGIVTSLETSEQLGKEPLAKIIDWIDVAGPDASLHLQPAQAIESLLERAHLKISDIDLFEINEAFASVVLASKRKLGLPLDVINVNGGAIALGHPLAASGFRLVLTLAKELNRRGGGKGIATLCGGGGQGSAILIEV